LPTKNLSKVPQRGQEGEISATGYDLIAIHLAGLKAPDTNPAFTPHFLPSVEYAPQLMAQWRVSGMLPVQLLAPRWHKKSQNVPKRPIFEMFADGTSVRTRRILIRFFRRNGLHGKGWIIGDPAGFGRVTYEMMEAAWQPPARTGARPDWHLIW
jgi:hypothetical protein